MFYRPSHATSATSSTLVTRHGIMARIPNLCAWASVLLGLAVIVGWTGDVRWLKTPISDGAAMKMNSAISFVLLGAAVLCALYEDGVRRRIAATLCVAAAVLAGLTLFQYVSGTDLGIDALFHDVDRDITATIRGRMSPTTAVSFVLIAGSILADLKGGRRLRHAANFCAGLAIIIAFVNIVGYLYGAPALYLDERPVESVAIHTAMGIAILALGCLALHPHQTVSALLTQESMAGSHFRTLLPASILLPIAIGGAALLGYSEIYSANAAVALTAVGSSVAIALLVTATHLLLSRAEEFLRLEDRALSAAEVGVVITDHRAPDEPVVYVNPAFTKITGFEANEVLGTNCRMLNIQLTNADRQMDTLRSAIREGRPCQVEIQNARKNGELFWNSLSLAPVYDNSGAVTHFVGFLEDITRDKEREGRLREALRDVSRTRNAMDSFVRIMSHELRGPLNAASTWVALMEMDASPEHLTQGLNAIRNSIDDQARLIEDLVEGTRAASPTLELETESLDLVQLLAHLVDEWNPRFLDKQQTLTHDLVTGACVMRGDPTRLRQIFGNLLSNASNYTPPEGQISLMLRTTPMHYIVTIADNGSGISAEQIEQVFDPYWRGKSKVKGLGLGLSIVKALVEAHGGEITVRSDGPGKGAEFEVRLPRNGDDYAAVAVV